MRFNFLIMISIDLSSCDGYSAWASFYYPFQQTRYIKLSLHIVSGQSFYIQLRAWYPQSILSVWNVLPLPLHSVYIELCVYNVAIYTVRKHTTLNSLLRVHSFLLLFRSQHAFSICDFLVLQPWCDDKTLHTVFTWVKYT